MKKALFNEHMSSLEARRVLFTSVNGKSKEQIDEIKKEYSSVSKLIRRRELIQNKGWMTSE